MDANIIEGMNHQGNMHAAITIIRIHQTIKPNIIKPPIIQLFSTQISRKEAKTDKFANASLLIIYWNNTQSKLYIRLDKFCKLDNLS